MLPIKKDLYISQGDDYETSFTLLDNSGLPFDLTGYTPESLIKKYYQTAKVYTSTAVVDGDPLNGILKMSISNLVTSTMDAERYVYNIKLTKDSMILTVVFGNILNQRF